MSRFALIAALSTGALFAALPASAEPLAGDALRKAISGRTVYVSTPIGEELPIRYKTGGAMHGRASASLAAMAGENKATDRGRWWIAGNKLCQRWNNWVSAKTSCYSFVKTGNSVRWVRSDGERGTARLG